MEYGKAGAAITFTIHNRSPRTRWLAPQPRATGDTSQAHASVWVGFVFHRPASPTDLRRLWDSDFGKSIAKAPKHDRSLFSFSARSGDDVRSCRLSVVLGSAGLGGPPWVGASTASTRPHHLPRHDGGLHQRSVATSVSSNWGGVWVQWPLSKWANCTRLWRRAEVFLQDHHILYMRYHYLHRNQVRLPSIR